MKKNYLKMFMIMLVFSISSSCITLQPEMLIPSSNALPNRIHNLTLVNTDVSAAAAKTIKGQNYLYTLVDRELKQNIFTNEEKSYGKVDIAEVYQKDKMRLISIPFVLLSVGSLGILNLMYMPFDFEKSYLEVDITISNNNGKTIKKYNYSTSQKNVIGCYRKFREPLTVDRYKSIMEKFKVDLNKDYALINKELEKE